jgi:hypothetical protein
MNRQVGLLLGVMASSCMALTLAACGDDTGTAPAQDAASDQTSSDATHADAGKPDAGGSTPDATVSDVSNDTTTPSEGGRDDGGALCALFDASALDEASVMAGFQQVWHVYRCYTCHQSPMQMVDDAGNGIVLSGNNAGLGDSGMVFPPNLTNDPTTGLGCWTDPQIVNAILAGARIDGGALCKPMPKFGAALTTADGGPRLGTPMDAGTAQQIVSYLRSLPVVANQVPATMCPAGASDGGMETGSDAAPDAAGDDGGDGASDATGQ